MDFEILETKERLLADQAAAAALVRHRTAEAGVYFINLMGSPGAGKTSVLRRILQSLPDPSRLGVLEADADGHVDAAAMAAAGARTIQLHTGGLCHMDADMTLRGLEGLGIDGVDLLVLENVGNLVCPAEFDVGADLRLVVLSVPEGDDKPLKYPLMFQVGDVLLVSKIDAAPAFDFDLDRLRRNLAPLNLAMPVFPVSAKTGEGFDPFLAWLTERRREKK